MTQNKNMPAFASVGYGDGGNSYMQEGLTKREYFAGLAMQGLLANSDWAKTMRIPDDWDQYKNRLTCASVELADELLKQLETSKTEK